MKQTPLQTILDYFKGQGQKPFRFQREAWKAYIDGNSGLVHSATGTGKTLAVWLGPILTWLKQNKNRNDWDPKKPPPLRILWITPLRALATDTENALRAPLEAMGLPWLLESRTGDSNARVKAKQLKRLPTALITTPESLCLLLTHASLQPQLSAIEGVIVDEWHELLGSKRGIQVELALARLRKLNPSLRTWGLSATLGNLNEAGQAIVGPSSNQKCIVDTRKNGTLSLVWSYWNPNGLASGSRDRTRFERTRFCEHSVAIRNLVSTFATTSPRLGRANRSAPRFVGYQCKRLG